MIVTEKQTDSETEDKKKTKKTKHKTNTYKKSILNYNNIGV